MEAEVDERVFGGADGDGTSFSLSLSFTAPKQRRNIYDVEPERAYTHKYTWCVCENPKNHKYTQTNTNE